MKHIFDPSFRYRASFATDVRETFEAARRRQRERAAESAVKADPDAQGRVLQLDQGKAKLARNR